MSTKNQSNDKVKELQSEVTERAREVWLAGLGALSTVEDEGTKLFKSLVEKGEGYEKKGKQKIDGIMADVSEGYKKVEKRISESFKKTEDEFESNVSKVVKGLGVPTKDEVGKLTDRVEKLTKQVEALAGKLDGEAKSAPAKKTAVKK